MTDGPVTDYSTEPETFPAELLLEERWFVWAYDDGRKIPRAPWYNDHHIDKFESWKNREMWTSFQEANDWVQKVPRFEPASCIPPRESNDEKRAILFDFDNCRDPDTGAIHPLAWEFIHGESREPLHAALSTSGTGIHGYAWASIPEGYKQSFEHELTDWDHAGAFDDPAHLEVYAGGRFIALTGDHIAETPTQLPELSETVHEMFHRFGTERVTGTDREPDLSRDELADLDTTDDLQDIYDAIAQTRPRDIRLKSTVTEERADGTKSLDPHWESSESGTRLAQMDDHWLYRKGNHHLDALQVVALEERIITSADEYPSGDDFVDAVAALRQRGADIPELDTGGGPDVTAADHAQEHTETDGGTAAADAPADVSRHDDLTPEERARQRILDRVIVPYDPPDDSDIESIDKQTAVHRAAEIYHEELAWLRPREDTRGWRATLYNYVPEDGIYEPHGEAELERMLDSHFGALADNELASQVIRKVERMARVNVRRLDEPPYELVVANGVLNLETGELSEHTPAKFHQTMVDIEYDPAADCSRVDDFLHDVVDDGDVPMLYRLIAHALYKEYEAEKAAMLLGDGQNGKSVFLSLVEQFLGEWNVSNQSLQKLNEDDWAANNLVGKLANVHPDMSDQTVSTMQMFKKLTGRDTIAADVKFEQPIRFENFATLIFACNRMPVLEDDTRGNWRRWILIDFPNTFERGDDEYVPKQELMAELTAEEELQGLLTRCVEEIQRWADGEQWFPDAPHWKEARKQIRRAAEPIYDFTHACLERGDDYVEKEAVRHCYASYAEAEGLPSMSREEFGRKLINESDMAIESSQKRIDGQHTHVYENIEFTSRGKQLLENDPGTHTDSKQDSLGSPRARANRVVRLCFDIKDEHLDEGNVSHELLIGAAVQDGMQIEQAEAAIEKARRQGDLAGTEESGYLPGA